MRIDLEPDDWVAVVDALICMSHVEAGHSQAPHRITKQETGQWHLAEAIKQKINTAAAEEPPTEAYELDDPDRELIIKLREAMEYHRNGDPVRDLLYTSDFIEAVELLLAVVDSGAAK
jgi:hypothetical protein